MTNAPQWARIPVELTQRAQWCIAGPDKSPHALDAQGHLYRASVTDARTWLDFNTAATYAWSHGCHIGYVISDDDPFACIDLDVCDPESQQRKGKPVDPSQWTTAEHFQLYVNIVNYLGSYTERSTYGKGLHIWVRAAIGHGCKRNGVEVYSQERFIICTGDVLVDKPLAERQQMLEEMVSQMRGVTGPAAEELVELEEEDNDGEVFERASTAANADKFNGLCAGKWEEMGFPSQSEADLALMSMFTFYSVSNEQCRRLFRCTALGKRKKAVKDDRYLNFTLKLIRGRQAREREDRVRESGMAAALVAQFNRKHESAAATPLHVPSPVEPVVQVAPEVQLTAMAPVSQNVLNSYSQGMDYPPGFVGDMAKFIYDSSPRPVKEVAIVAALGLLAGIVGKAWCISQSGLNLYIVLVARSAVGKEAMHSGVSLLCKHVIPRCPTIMNFVNFSDFASGPALVKACAGANSFVNVAGEWGRKLRAIAQSDGKDGPLSSLRTAMTNLYQKSGPQSIVGGISYSNQDSNVASVNGVAYSMIGETTPKTFYEALTETMMEDGFLSRFTMVEYSGERPAANKHPAREPPAGLGEYLAAIAQKAIQTHAQINASIPVDKTGEAAWIFEQFELECDGQINSTDDEAWRQMWNRASLKSMRIAAVLAVGDSFHHPTITRAHAEWAIALVRKDIALFQKRLEAGDVGSGDHTRERKLVAVIKDYLEGNVSEGYKVPAPMQQAGIVPRKFLQVRSSRQACFTQHKLGAANALEQTLRSMVDCGYMSEVSKDDMTKYRYSGKAYRILELPFYDEKKPVQK